MKRLFSSTLLLIFIFSICFPVLPHSNHPPDWEARDIAQRAKWNSEENLWRPEEKERLEDEEKRKKGAWQLLSIVLNPAMGAVVSASLVLDDMFGGRRCPLCKELVNTTWEHRNQCKRGHWYWGCHIMERNAHKWCLEHPTDCTICGGGGCHYCWDYDDDVPICVKCGARGAHHCTAPSPDPTPDPSPDPDPVPDPDPDDDGTPYCPYCKTGCSACQ